MPSGVVNAGCHPIGLMTGEYMIWMNLIMNSHVVLRHCPDALHIMGKHPQADEQINQHQDTLWIMADSLLLKMAQSK